MLKLRFVKNILAIVALTSVTFAHAKCNFLPPAEWDTAKDIRWEGECSKGFANGLGVLKLIKNGKVESSFLGRLDRGQPVLGILENNGSFQAGNFKDGINAPVADADGSNYNDINKGLNEAIKAAKFVANRFRKAGNIPSAKFYEDKAKQIPLMLGE